MSETFAARRPYRSDLSDERWALIEPMLVAWRAKRVGLGIGGPRHDLREIVNAILYVNRTGIAWEYLPHDFPPYKTVYDYYAKWEADGSTEAIHDAVRGRVRTAASRVEQSSAVAVDAQSVKTSGNVAESSQGIDAGKKIKGRKRHIAVDTLGLLLVVLVTAASVHDTVGGRVVLDELAVRYPRVVKAWVDGAYQRSVVGQGAKHGIAVEVVSREPGRKGFTPLPMRWVAERTFGWLMLHRRLVRDYETLPERSRTMVFWSMLDNMTRRLTGESTQTWRPDPALAVLLP